MLTYGCINQQLNGRLMRGVGFEQEQEEFFTVKWGIDERTGAPLLLAAGLEGVCRVLNCNTQDLEWVSPCFSLLLPAVTPSALQHPLV